MKIDALTHQTLQDLPLDEVNNKGVHLIENGKYKEAVIHFIVVNSRLNERLASAAGTMTFSAETSALLQNLAAFLIVGDERVFSVSVGSEKALFVVRNPMLISNDINVFGYGAYFPKLFSLVAIHNLALSYHLCGLQQNSRQQLEQALIYYEAAYNLLLSQPVVVINHTMAMLNNIGQIHSLLQNSEGAKSCFQKLLYTLMFLQQIGESERIQNWDSFFSNVMDLLAAGQLPAAAA